MIFQFCARPTDSTNSDYIICFAAVDHSAKNGLKDKPASFLWQPAGAEAGIADGSCRAVAHGVPRTHRRHPFTIDAIVVLPDHLHAVWTLPEGDADFAMRWQPVGWVEPLRNPSRLFRDKIAS